MGAWFTEQFSNPTGLMNDIPSSSRTQFEQFEGNAQGFRILTRLEMYRNEGGMRLSKATLGAFTKYPVSASTRAKVNSGEKSSYVGLKKFGIFDSELSLFAEVAETLSLPEESQDGMKWWRRHPLVFVVEAADDICYNIVDLEDAFTTGELTYKMVKEVLDEAIGSESQAKGRNEAEHIAYLRARSIGMAIAGCVDVFKENYTAIMDGTFNAALTDIGSVGPLFRRMRQLSSTKVFTARRKTELEISGRKIISNVMSGILPVFNNLRDVEWDCDKLSAHSKQLARALELDLRDISSSEQALHVLADFTSGMTDRYALRISRMLSGA